MMKISTNKKEIICLLRTAVPAILSQLAIVSFGVIDTIMVGQLSAQDLAAYATANNVFCPFLVFVIGLFFALNPIAAQHYGRGDKQAVNSTIQQGFIIAILCVVPMFFVLRQMAVFMTWLGVEPQVIPVANEYLKALSWGCLPLFGFLVLRFVNDGLMTSRLVMICSLASIPLNITLNYCLIYGRWGFTQYGAVGAGYATVITWFAMFLLLFWLTSIHPKLERHGILTRQFRPRLREIWEIVRVGVPIAMATTLEVTMFALTGLLISRFSVAEMASHQVAMNVASLAFMIPLGISIATTARVGYAKGQQSIVNIKASGYGGLILSIGFMCVIASLMVLFRESIVAMYTTDLQVQTIAAQLIFFAAIFQLSDGLQVVALGALRGLKDTTIPMFICLIAYWGIGFPLGYYLGIVEGMRADGFWIAFIAGLTAAAILHFLRFYRLVNSKKMEIELGAASYA